MKKQLSKLAIGVLLSGGILAYGGVELNTSSEQVVYAQDIEVPEGKFMVQVKSTSNPNIEVTKFYDISMIKAGEMFDAEKLAYETIEAEPGTYTLKGITTASPFVEELGQRGVNYMYGLGEEQYWESEWELTERDEEYPFEIVHVTFEEEFPVPDKESASESDTSQDHSTESDTSNDQIERLKPAIEPSGEFYTSEDFPDYSDEEVLGAQVWYLQTGDTDRPYMYKKSPKETAVNRYDDNSPTYNFELYTLSDTDRPTADSQFVGYRDNRDGTVTLYTQPAHYPSQEEIEGNPEFYGDFYDELLNNTYTMDIKVPDKEAIAQVLKQMTVNSDSAPDRDPDDQPDKATEETSTDKKEQETKPDESNEKNKASEQTKDEQSAQKPEEIKEHKSLGERLPNTATTTWVLLVVAGIALAAGLGLKYYNNKKK